MNRVAPVLVAVLAVGLAACGTPPHDASSASGRAVPAATPGAAPASEASGGNPTPSTTAPSTTTAPPTSTTTGPPSTVPSGTSAAGAQAVGTIPQVITPAYVQSVLAELDSRYGDALRSAVATDHITAAAIHAFNAVLTPGLVPLAVRALEATLSQHFAGVRRAPGNVHTQLLKLITSSHQCIFARVLPDYSKVDVSSPGPPPGYEEFEGLQPRSILNAKNGDPTPWVIFYDDVVTAPAKVSNQCRGA